MTAPPAPPQLLPMEEGDLEEAARMEIWGNPADDAQRVILERERTPAGLARLAARHRKTLRDDPRVTFLKAVDPATGNMMAWAAWHWNPALTPEELARGPDAPEWPLPQFFLPYLQYRREWLKGRPHYWLGMIVTAPEYRRRGAASLLVQWGLDKADEEGVEIYLESSVAGRPVYEKFGLRVLKVVKFDMAQLGYEGVDTHICMWRPVGGQDG